MKMETAITAKTVISIINPLNPWGEELSDVKADGVPCFHDCGWAAVLNESYGFEPYYLESSSGGVRSGMLPLMTTSYPFGFHKRGVSLPFTDFCEPYAVDKPSFEALFQTAIGLGRSNGWRYLELRGAREWLPLALCNESYFGHVLNVNKEDGGLLAAMDDSTRRNVRNAQRRKVRYSSEQGWDAVHAFYRLHCRTRKKHGVPPQPVRFFRSLHHHVIDKGNGFIALARSDDRIAAAAVFLLYGKHAIFKFGASDERLLPTRANDLVMWEAARECRDRGARTLYFGRTDPGNLGLRRFKRGFGAREYPISYFRYDINAGKFSVSKHGRGFNGRLLSRMPVFLLRAIGEMMYPFVG